jgi:phosphodiesterase/alkaline phosphatase D-like protein
MPARPRLVLGPLLRHIGDHEAVVWMETNQEGTVVVRLSSGARALEPGTARTVRVGLRHYALVALAGLSPNTWYEYAVDFVPGESEPVRVWPDRFLRMPPSSFRTLPHAGVDLSLAFVSCRLSRPPQEVEASTDGVDALRAWARRIRQTHRLRRLRWPHLMLMTGDQIYADNPSGAMRRRLEASRKRAVGDGLPEMPADQLLSLEEFAQAYVETWSEPELRWALSCIPSLMIFDDHEIVDDWNISSGWKRQKEALPWWGGQLSGGLIAYWIYQGAGNLAPAQWRKDPLMRSFVDASRTGGAGARRSLTATAGLRHRMSTTLAGRGPRFGYVLDVGPARIVVADCRTKRVLGESDRTLMNAEEWDWLARQCTGSRHPFLFLVSSLPAFMPSVIHALWGAVEGLNQDPWLSVFGEWIRQKFDAEHWAAFPRSFEALAGLLRRLASPQGGAPKRLVSILSGDVHFSYNMTIDPNVVGSQTRIVQLVSSPARHVLAGGEATAVRIFAGLSAAPASSSGVTWEPLTTPNGWLWIGNFVATLDLGLGGLVGTYERATLAEVQRDGVTVAREPRLVPVSTIRVH